MGKDKIDAENIIDESQSAQSDRDKLTWYEKNSKKLCTICKVLSIVNTLLVFSLMVMHSVGRIIISAPEYKNFYKSYVVEDYIGYMLFLGAAFGFAAALFAFVGQDYNQKLRSGVVRYNMAIIAELVVIATFIIEDMIIFRRIDLVGIVLVLSFVYYVFVLVNVIKNYFANESKFSPNPDSAGVGVIVILMLVIGAATVAPLWDIKAKVKNLSDKYSAREYGKMIDVMFVQPDKKLTDRTSDYIALQYVNLFNDKGRTFTVEEIETAVNNLYYYTGSWYSIMEFNDLYNEIEEKNDFSQYYNPEDIEGDNDGDLYRYMVYDKLEHMGIEYPQTSNEEVRKKVDEACVLVHDMLVTGKPLETIGESGDVITVTYDSGINIGQNVSYDLSYDYELTHAIISQWERVPYVGSNDWIEVSRVTYDTQLNFKDNSVYKATISVYPEVTYKLNTDIKVELKGLDYEKIEYDVSSDAIKMYVWVIVGDKEEISQVKQVDTVEIKEIPGLVLAGNVADRMDATEISLGENVLCQDLNWLYFDTNKSYYKYCNPEYEGKDSVKTFVHKNPVYCARLRIHPDTGYAFSEELKVTYNGFELERIDKKPPMVDITGYYEMDSDGEIIVNIYFYAVEMYGEHGIITSDVAFAAHGTVVTMTPQPDEGYVVDGYESKCLMTGTPKDSKIEIEDNKLYMKTYPVEIKWTFREK